jgi:hypothetical protein
MCRVKVFLQYGKTIRWPSDGFWLLGTNELDQAAQGGIYLASASQKWGHDHHWNQSKAYHPHNQGLG